MPDPSGTRLVEYVGGRARFRPAPTMVDQLNCARKVAYATDAEAHSALLARREHTGGLTMYRCAADPTHWHLGHRRTGA